MVSQACDRERSKGGRHVVLGEVELVKYLIKD